MTPRVAEPREPTPERSVTARRPAPTAKPPRFWSAHSTGLTISLLVAMAVGLSIVPGPVPDWLRPLDSLAGEEPIRTFVSEVFKRPGGHKTAEVDADLAAADAPPESEEPPKEEIIPDAKPVARKKWVMPPRPKFDEMAKKMNASPAALVVPCVDGTEQACKARALDGFFASLLAAEEGREEGVVRVVHYGDSLIASDHITDVVRSRLQERFGSAGRGFLLVDRLSRFAGRRVRTGVASEGWKLDVITAAQPRDRFFGYTGASFMAEREGEEVTFELGPNRMVEIFYLQHPEGGALEILADDKLVRTVDTSTSGQTSECLIYGFAVPRGTKDLKLRARTRGVRVFGVSLEAGVPGVIYESVGLPGATNKVWVYPDLVNFRKQLTHRDPSLIVTMLGGNDSMMLSKKRTTIEAIEQDMRTFIQRLHESAPDTDCLIVSPMDSARSKVSGEIESKPEVRQVLEVQKRVAAQNGCAFWDMWTSMGGDGSLKRWNDAGMINPDMIHPQKYGGDLLGELMVTAVMDGYDKWLASNGLTGTAGARDKAPALGASSKAVAAWEDTAGAGAFEPFYAKLRALEKERKGRVAILQVGSTETARGIFVERTRELLGARFQSRGRGYNAPAEGGPVLREAGVARELKGGAVRDGSDGDTTLGLSGMRTELKKGGSFVFAPCVRCPPSQDAHRFEVYYLSRRGGGRAQVMIGGKAAKVIDPSSSRPKLEVASFDSESDVPARLELRALGPGSFDLFGVAHEIDRPGLVYDSASRFGIAADAVLKWDRRIVQDMVRARRPDLLVLFFGVAEIARPGFDADEHQKAYLDVVSRLRAAAADAPCVLIGPLATMSKSDGGRWTEDAGAAAVTAAQRAVARRAGCAYWPASVAMGGPDAAEVWHKAEPKLMEADHRSLTAEGYRALAARFVEDLLARYDAAGRAGQKNQPD